MVFALLLGYYALALTNKITINGGELGFLLKEGELVLTEGKILTTNYFTYTNPDHPVLNHHWAGCAIFYLVQATLGFGGLQLFALLLQLFAFGFLFRYLLRQWDDAVLWLGVVGVLVVPTYALHPVIEPAVFSMALVSLFLVLVWRFLKDDINQKYLWALPVLQLFWANLHGGFFFGWLILLAGVLQAIANAPQENWLTAKVRRLLILLGISFGLTLFNPQWFAGMFSPFIWLLSTTDYASGDWLNLFSIYLATKTHTLLYVIVGILAGLYGLTKVFRSENFKDNRIFLGIVILSLMAWGGASAANIVFIGPAILLSLGLSGIVFAKKQPGLNAWVHRWSPAVSFYLLVPIFVIARFYAPVQGEFGWGMQIGAMDAGRFLSKIKPSGPIFHNLGGAGYLAYHIGDQEKLYVRNQKGTHPNNFFTKEYFPNIHKVVNWKELEEKYKFNVIYFKLQGENNENLVFLGNRLGEKDPLTGNYKWALVYHEKERDAIMLRRTPKNTELIDLYEMQVNATNNPTN